jgi:hypothetical protein
MADLFNVLKSTYESKTQSAKDLAKQGFIFDNQLSNVSTRVYHNPKNNKVLLTSRGTHNLLNDLPSDLHIFNNSIKSSTRYKETKHIYNQAKDKYHVDGLTLAGHSLGGSLVSALGGKNDSIYSLNKGKSLFDFHTAKQNEHAYRHKSDLVSIAAINDNNTINLGSNPFSPLILTNHKVDIIKNKRIRI